MSRPLSTRGGTPGECVRRLSHFDYFGPKDGFTSRDDKETQGYSLTDIVLGKVIFGRRKGSNSSIDLVNWSGCPTNFLVKYIRLLLFLIGPRF